MFAQQDGLQLYLLFGSLRQQAAEKQRLIDKRCLRLGMSTGLLPLPVALFSEKPEAVLLLSQKQGKTQKD